MDSKYVEVAVCGLHMRGYALNYQLTDLDAVFDRIDKTSPNYLMKLLPGDVEKPFLMYSDNGKELTVEVWSIPVANLGLFLTGIPSPLGLGKIKLVSKEIIGFVGQAGYGDGYKDISSYGGWSGYVSSKKE